MVNKTGSKFFQLLFCDMKKLHYRIQQSFQYNLHGLTDGDSEAEISGMAGTTGAGTPLGERDLAIILVAYCTGLRGVGIVGIKLTDIDWRNKKVSAIQPKTHTPLVCELNGMNALADYVLDSRPKYDVPEAFVTSKVPYRRLGRHLGGMIDKYCRKAGAFRSFYSYTVSF